MERLNVYLCNRLAGVLTCAENGEIEFCYDADYLESTDAAVPSLTLPLSSKPYGERDISAFFSNLLPDENVRVRIAEILHLTPEDTFGLLRILGGDCAGAVAFYEPGNTPLSPIKPTFRSLTEVEASDLLRNLSSRPLGIDDEFRGISGAGAQDKLIACLKDGRISLPLGGTPSTHIIKPGIERFPESVFNEWFCMRIFKACGFDTADCDVFVLQGLPYYVTTRYDRLIEGNVVSRLHQEDFCQLLRCRPEVKYQDQGGPSIVECARLLKTLRLPGTDILSFVDRVVMNFIIGNGDAHGKNFSVLYRGKIPRLAPVYDALCTTVYPAIAKKMAMKLDGQFEFRWVTLGKFVRTFERAGIGERIVRDSIVRQIARIQKVLPALLKEANAAHPSRIYAEIADGITRRILQLG